MALSGWAAGCHPANSSVVVKSTTGEQFGKVPSNSGDTRGRICGNLVSAAPKGGCVCYSDLPVSSRPEIVVNNQYIGAIIEKTGKGTRYVARKRIRDGAVEVTVFAGGQIHDQ